MTNIFPRLSVYENVRCGALWSKGYRYSFLKSVEDLEDVNLLTEEILEQIRLTDRFATPA